MKHFKLVAASFAVSLTLLTGCQKESDSLVTPKAASQSSQASAASSQKLAQLRASLPAEFQLTFKPNVAQALQAEPQYREILRRATAVTPTACNSNTAVNAWLRGELADWIKNPAVFTQADAWFLLDLPTIDALYFENSSENQSFGVNGEYTQPLTKSFKDLKRFWNIQTDGMVLAAMHGNMLLDRERLTRSFMAGFNDVNEELGGLLADIVIEITSTTPEYRGGNHPYFTFNAFALQGFGDVPNKIVMGDGIMDAYTGIGYEDVAPQAILAHEFGHQIQFQLKLFPPGPPTAEGTRRTELMADAYSAYYLSHARGAAMQWKRVRQFLQVFLNIGDCGFTSSGHHGTPTQRLAAAEWGYSVANNAQKQGHILTSQEFAKLFDAELPRLVKL